MGTIETWRRAAPNLARRLRLVVPAWIWALLLVAIGAALATVIVEQGDSWSKYFLALVGVVIASTTSFAGARALNEAADHRAAVRRRHAALLRLSSLLAEMENFLAFVDQVLASGVNPTEKDTMACYVRVRAIQTAASTKPDFDEFLNTKEDLRYAGEALREFRFAAAISGLVNEGATIEQKIENANVLVDDKIGATIKNAIAILKMAAQHFENQQSR